jgi:hypothetical protein
MAIGTPDHSLSKNSRNDRSSSASNWRIGFALPSIHVNCVHGFPPPLYRIATKRPFFTEEMQETCLGVRQRNCGINGRPVLFYARRLGATISKAKATPPKNSHKHADLIEGLRALGLTFVNSAQVEAAVQKCFSSGRSAVNDETVLRTVFLHLKRQNSSDNVG